MDSSDLEKDAEKDDPVKYHEAWQVVCRAEFVYAFLNLKFTQLKISNG